MKNFLMLTAMLSLSNFAINADEFKVSNKFKSQIYVTVMSGDDMENTLINGNGTSSIAYDEDIDKIIINFQQPGVAPITISKDKIPAFFKLLTIFASRKISLS